MAIKIHRGFMFSVIIPTMWRSKKILKLLKDLQNSNFVNEIILIDNDTSKKWVDISDMNKIKYLPQEENIFVNPAWNLGVATAKNNLLCICNDDINFDVESTFKQVLDNSEKLGVFGSRLDIFNFEKRLKGFKEIKTATDFKHAIVIYGFGMLMFLKKENWIPIPENLKIWFGDNWIIGSHVNSFSTTYDFKIEADEHTTAGSKDLSKFLRIDSKHWKELKSKHKRF